MGASILSFRDLLGVKIVLGWDGVTHFLSCYVLLVDG